MDSALDVNLFVKIASKTSNGSQCTNINFVALSKANESINKTKREFEYIIKENVIIHPNFDYVMLGNKQLWSNINDPINFDINRWINIKKDNKLSFHNNNNSMPFGIGVRECVGQSLAIKELYSFLANLFINYKFSLVEKDITIKYQTYHTKKIEPQIPIYVESRKIDNNVM